jgi:hypothetical protein
MQPAHIPKTAISIFLFLLPEAIKQPRRQRNPYQQKYPYAAGEDVVIMKDLREGPTGEHQPHEELERNS